MSQIFARRLLMTLIALALMISVGLSGFFSGAQNTNHPTTTPAPITVVPTSIPTPVVDVWQPIRECDIAYAKVEIAKVPADDTHPESYDGSNTSEVWETYVFGDQSLLDSVDTDRLNDRWGNPITSVKSNATLDDLPTTALAVWIYNEFGYLAGWDGSGWDIAQLEVTGFCHANSGEVTWANIEELTLLGDYSFVYPTDQIKVWYSAGFTVEVYSGNQLSTSELATFDFQMRGLNLGDHWAGLGFVGPSTSTHGMFDLTDQNQMVWEFKWFDPDYDIYEFTGIVLPLNTEIIVKTTTVSGEISLQRFVLVPGYYSTPDMIEPLDQPLYTLP